MAYSIGKLKSTNATDVMLVYVVKTNFSVSFTFFAALLCWRWAQKKREREFDGIVRKRNTKCMWVCLYSE